MPPDLPSQRRTVLPATSFKVSGRANPRFIAGAQSHRAASRAKYLAFIDDDHCAAPHWLASHYRIANQTQAAVVIGSTDYVFDDEVPDFIRNCKFFINRPCADGETLPWFLGTTANCLIRRDALPTSAPFSSEFDLTGGEDVDLFFRMAEAGALIVACDHAYTVSYHPASRANLYWCMRRAFRIGGTSVEIVHRRRHWWQKLKIGAIAGAKGVRSAIGAIWVWPSNRTIGMRRLLRANEQLGSSLAYVESEFRSTDITTDGSRSARQGMRAGRWSDTANTSGSRCPASASMGLPWRPCRKIRQTLAARNDPYRSAFRSIGK